MRFIFGNGEMDVNLILLKKNGSQRVIPMPSSVTVIGRQRNCDLRIPLMSVSKRHCQLSYSDGILKIRDLGSRNGISHNGKAVEEAEIAAGDSIEIGPLKFIFQIDGKPEKIVDTDLTTAVLAEIDGTAEVITKGEPIEEPGAHNEDTEEMIAISNLDESNEQSDDFMEQFGDLDDLQDPESQ